MEGGAPGTRKGGVKKLSFPFWITWGQHWTLGQHFIVFFLDFSCFNTLLMVSHINLCKVCCLKVRKGKYNFIVNLIPKSINGIISNTWDFNMIQIFHRVVLALWAPAPKFIQDRDYAWIPDLTWIWQDRECTISIVSNLAHTFSKIKTQIIGDLEISKTSSSFQHWSTKQNNNKNGWCRKKTTDIYKPWSEVRQKCCHDQEIHFIFNVKLKFISWYEAY